jgi:hypothetical protein
MILLAFQARLSYTIIYVLKNCIASYRYRFVTVRGLPLAHGRAGAVIGAASARKSLRHVAIRRDSCDRAGAAQRFPDCAQNRRIP